jgi:uncharacterized protein YdaU (DUF1376 family)
MAKFPALPLFTDAFLADTAHLSMAELGIYVRLLIMMWRTPGCRIPNDDEWISRRLHVSVEDVQKLVRPLISEFCKTHNNFCTQHRLSREFEFLRRRSENQSNRAKSRWRKEKHVCPEPCRNDAQIMPPHPHEVKKERKKEKQESTEVVVEGAKGGDPPSDPPVDRQVLGENDFASDDGSVIFTAEEFEHLKAQHPSVKNIRGLVRHACRSWLRTIAPHDRKQKFLTFLRNRDADAIARPAPNGNGTISKEEAESQRFRKLLDDQWEQSKQRDARMAKNRALREERERGQSEH